MPSVLSRQRHESTRPCVKTVFRWFGSPRQPKLTSGLAKGLEGHSMISELRPYQLQTLADIRDSVRGGVRRLVVQAATGAGKTKLAAAIVDAGLSKGSRTAFVVPAISLV